MLKRLQTAEGNLDHKLLALGIRTLNDYNYALDSHFHKGIVPFYTKYVKILTKEENWAFCEILKNGAELGVEDEEFWRGVKETFVMQRMYR